MRRAHGSLAAALVVDLRTPLARVALAASRLAREADTPSQRVLAAVVGGAVCDLDARIERIAELLVALPPDAGDDCDLATLLREMRGRLAPGLAARRIEWLAARGCAAGVRAEPHRARRCAVALLRAGAQGVGAGGALRMEPASRDGRPGLAIECLPESGAGRPEALDGLHEFAASQGARLEPAALSRGFGVTLWLGREA